MSQFSCKLNEQITQYCSELYCVAQYHVVTVTVGVCRVCMLDSVLPVTAHISSVNNSIRVETVWCPDGSSIINIIPDCEAHFSLWWGCMSVCVPPTPTRGASQGTVFGPCSILVSNRRVFGALSPHLHVKTSPGSGCKGPNLEWQSSARDSWSTKEAWLSSSSQSPAAPLTHSTSIQQTHRRERVLPRALACSCGATENGYLFV